MTEAEKRKLRDEIYLKNRILAEGIAFEPDIFRHLALGVEYTERVHCMFSRDKHWHSGVEFPDYFLTPEGNYWVRIHWNTDSPLSLRYEDGQYNVYDGGKAVFEKVGFPRRPAYYRLNTSDGTAMRTVAVDAGYGALIVAYSNECSLKDKGLDCLFCNINATKAAYGEAQGIGWKTPRQAGESVAAAYREGFDHVTVSGGFIAERRELEYYLDVAEAVREHTGLEDFNGTADIGAPLDFSVLEKYKAVGYRTIATNLEIWNEKLFGVICPGKARLCGGWRNCLAALDEELRVFGKHRVRSSLVSGIEPKASLLEGVEYLAERGVLPVLRLWNVAIGSRLEGHRTPAHDWHWDVYEKTAALYKKHGFSWEEMKSASVFTHFVPFDLFRLEAGIEAKEPAQARQTAA
ncbi:radical SAM protein [Treponema endosymbiont of Eucomonympha sp.]|uniref:radical SAM protein n=4 Tax=Treponema endosymbiont of Eucomonympha sp. TaxID=1580831 RepID=UPI0007518CF8|nr:radical SAM protein [Treponema endosymbiont of Eucomonympha sp.]